MTGGLRGVRRRAEQPQVWSDYAADNWRENCTNATASAWHNHTRQPHAFEKAPLAGGPHWEIGPQRCFDPGKDIAIPVRAQG